MNRLLFLGTGAADWDISCKGDFFSQEFRGAGKQSADDRLRRTHF